MGRSWQSRRNAFRIIWKNLGPAFQPGPFLWYNSCYQFKDGVPGAGDAGKQCEGGFQWQNSICCRRRFWPTASSRAAMC